MAKTATIVIRVDEDTKKRITSAAHLKGRSLTTFMLQAAEKEARRIEREEPKDPGVHRGVPPFFKACCYEARQGGMGYTTPGYHLAISRPIPEPDDWAEEIERLLDMLDADDDDGVWDWFRNHYPKCMELVPSRRSDQFLAGVFQAWGHGRIKS